MLEQPLDKSLSPGGPTGSASNSLRVKSPRELGLRPVVEQAESQSAVEVDDPAWDTEAASWMSADTQAFLVSMMFHVVLLLALAVVPLVVANRSRPEVLIASNIQPEDEFTLIEDVAISDEPTEEIGAGSSIDTESSMALSSAPTIAELSEVPAPASEPSPVSMTFELTSQIQQAVGITRSDTVVKGMTGVGTTGTDGAVDRITYEILQSMEERPTLVVWFFDQSGSLSRRRQEIRDRFDRIYEELGIVGRSREEEIARESEEPLLTSIFAFGEQVHLLTGKPTADIEEIHAAIDSIENDASGVERVFSALYKGCQKFRRYRSGLGGRGSERNVIFIAVTDERGDDSQGLDATIAECRKFAIPVYVIGVPAPFGRETTFVKYVDPDPRFDQTPQWPEVDQGPESILPERVKLGFRDDSYREPVVDSGFGPYALSRLAYETGGIYFTVHPNRRVGSRVRRREVEEFASNLEYFFDPEVMNKYRPDYVSAEEYLKRVADSPLRQVLVQAAKMPRVDTLENPETRFVKRSDAGLVTELTRAQQQAARIEPQLAASANLLSTGEQHLDREASPRWLAGFELALGTVLAHKVRAETYNAMLAKAKRGMSFANDKNNTWILKPANEITIGSRVEKEGEKARQLLAEVAERHRGTPWGFMASRELQVPVGWKWVEEYTDLNPPPSNNNANPNNNPPPPRDDEARMLPKPPPRRPLPKL